MPSSIWSFSLKLAFIILPASVSSSYISSNSIFNLFWVTQFVISSTLIFNKLGTLIDFPFDTFNITESSLMLIFVFALIFCEITMFLSIVSLNSYSMLYLMPFLFNHKVALNKLILVKSIISIFSSNFSIP